MIRNSMRSTRLLSWRSLRWAIVIPALPLVWWACTSHPLAQPNPEPEMQTDVLIPVAPTRLLDLVFMVDNSPSMAPKVSKMNAQFPKLIEALKDPSDKSLPDLRVAVIDSDLGTGGAYPSGSCGPKTLPDGTNSAFGDLGRFQMRKEPTACTFNDGALFLEYKSGAPQNYTGDINTVFACLASNLGTMGCGIEHQIQAFEFALAAKGVGNDEQQAAFLRPNAYLGLVILSDEDDCSAATNDVLFGDKPELRGESASLKCATRAHKCAGIGNLADNGPKYPTVASFEQNVTQCEARMDDECGDRDTSGPTDCNPYKSIKVIAKEMKDLKGDPENQLLVAGIFGMPITKEEEANAKYKIAPVPNPNTADTQHPTVFDIWPVCYDPDHQPNKPDSATGYDVDAAGWGAPPGLRLAAFVNEFGINGLPFSICQRDFSTSMKVIGDAIAKRLQNLCVDYKLVDTNPDAAQVQADCRVAWRRPVPDPKDSKKIIFEEDSVGMPQCPTNSTMGNVEKDCWQLTSDKVKCPINGQLIQVLRTADEIRQKPQLDPGTKVGMQCRTCTDTIPGVADVQKGCNYTL